MLIQPLVPERKEAVARVYQAAFAGFPWFEDLTFGEVMARLDPLFEKPGFTGMVMFYGDDIVGAHWHDILSLQQLRADRSNDLAQWVIDNGHSDKLLIWERELIVHPEFQCQGRAYVLRQAFLKKLIAYKTPLLVLTRLREDNIGSIKSAERIGMTDTGVTKPASQAPLKHHYWALTVG
ncbi:MAG: hypothetical protein UT32_C0013G0020 [Parcubacteria group bacterium GW2011_GWC2_39_14]|nr:MAG: hypothetical protein UT32_C0013G0020 [Parcubacteria group bacterium GW2011_GWC2_39_14]KKR54508.1 MAG: hypothetical protein UT91_C0014G0020 [Parcubacteria group bacterium GW2011_GWA2_40_23]